MPKELGDVQNELALRGLPKLEEVAKAGQNYRRLRFIFKNGRRHIIAFEGLIREGGAWRKYYFVYILPHAGLGAKWEFHNKVASKSDDEIPVLIPPDWFSRQVEPPVTN